MKIKIPFYFFMMFLLLILAGCTSSTDNTDQEAENVVTSYFEAWGNDNFRTMYEQISDGFKEIEPSAKTFEDFKSYAEAQGIDEVKILSIKQSSNDGRSATVDYNIEFVIKGKIVPFKGTYTLKNKPDDSLPGWKLTHPYGDNIDTS